MLDSLRRLFSGKSSEQPAPQPRPRLSSDQWPAALYAIGDIHGCLDELRQLERQIVADAAGIAGDKWLISLGDIIDRGPHSAEAVEHLMSPPPPGFTRFCLAGNHEQMFNAFLAQPHFDSPWLSFGGWETLTSYGLDQQRAQDMSMRVFKETVQSLVPREHVDFLAALPSAFSLPGTVLVHAGIRRGTPIEDQEETDLLWIREPFLTDAPTDGLRVVHGHTPVPEPEAVHGRIGIDTAAYATGRLTAVWLDATSHRFLEVHGSDLGPDDNDV